MGFLFCDPFWVRHHHRDGGIRGGPRMNLKSVVAILVIVAVPVCAQARNPGAAKLTRADAQKVVKIISSDKAKTQTFCDIGKLGEQIEDANEKRDGKTADELSQKMKELEKNWVPNMSR
jgi:peptidoglycan hydrolase CwlO-like protein